MVEIAVQYNDTYAEVVKPFANNVLTPDGGTHLVGFRTALTRVINDYARKNSLLKEKEDNLTGDDIREGFDGSYFGESCQILSLKVRPRINLVIQRCAAMLTR